MLRFLDPALEARFERDGYTTVQLFSDEEADALAARFAELQSGRSMAGNVPDGSFYSTVFERDESFRAAHDAVIRTSVAPRIPAIVEGAQILFTALQTKTPGSPAVLLHQHPPFTDQPFERSVLCWCALKDCAAEAGTLTVVPGSHHLYRYLRTVDQGDFFGDYRQALSEAYAIPVPLRKGEAILFENSLIHGSTPNISKTQRPVMFSVFTREGAGLVAYRLDGAADRVQIISGGLPQLTGDQLVENGLDDIAGVVTRTLPNWSRRATLEEVSLLLAANRRATESFDPLEALDRERARRPQPRPRAFRWRSLGRFLPAALRTSLRRRFS